jgi:hypothetical protein
MVDNTMLHLSYFWWCLLPFPQPLVLGRGGSVKVGFLSITIVDYADGAVGRRMDAISVQVISLDR